MQVRVVLRDPCGRFRLKLCQLVGDEGNPVPHLAVERELVEVVHDDVGDDQEKDEERLKCVPGETNKKHPKGLG